MKIKKFQARTFAEALVLVKKELSDDAVILSTEEKKGANPYVEVTAAIDYDISKTTKEYTDRGKTFLDLVERIEVDDRVSIKDRLKRVQKSAAPSQAETIRKVRTQGETTARHRNSAAEAVAAQPAAPSAPMPGDGMTMDKGSAEFTRLVAKMTEEIKSEIENLRDTLSDMKSMGFEMALPPKKRMLLYFLRERAIREEYALLLCEKAKEIEEIPSLLLSNIQVKKHDSDMKSVMLIGPTGAGKTTTVAKLAARAIREGKKAAIINLDTYRIGAVEQVRIYARILGIPLSVVSTPKELKNSLARFAQTKDIIFIDTTGRNPRDEEYMSGLSEVCDTDVPMEVHLLMSANGDDEFLIDSYRYYRKLPVNYIAFSKVDEAVRYGSLYNLMLTYRKPVAYITTGQQVPRDIEFAGVDRLANLILKKGVS